MNNEIAIQLVDDVYIPEELKTPERNRKTTLEYLKDSTLKSVGKYGGFDIFSISTSPFEGKYFVIEDNLIKYYVHYKNYRFVPLDSMCQVGVWRDEDFTPIERGDESTMATHVFRNILLKKYKEVVSDKIQTKFGRYFWIRQIDWALHHDKYVYFMRLSGEEIGKVLEIVRIRDVDSWKKLVPISWGKTLKDQRIRLLISEQPVVYPSKDEYNKQKKREGLK